MLVDGYLAICSEGQAMECPRGYLHHIAKAALAVGLAQARVPVSAQLLAPGEHVPRGGQRQRVLPARGHLTHAKQLIKRALKAQCSYSLQELRFDSLDRRGQEFY